MSFFLMFVKNLFKIEKEKLNKLVTSKIEEKIGKNDLLVLDFRDKFLLPPSKKSLEMIHVDSEKTTKILRLLRDDHKIFINYLLKNNNNIEKENEDLLKFYFSKKITAKMTKNLTKLDLDEICNNIKSISLRLKSTFIINEKIDAIIKNIDLEEIVFIATTKNHEKLDFLNKVRCSPQLVLKNCKKNFSNFFVENKYKEICKNVFYKDGNK